MNEQAPPVRPVWVVTGSALLAVLTAATWWVWLGRDERTSRLNAAYDTAQVVGVVLTLAAVAFVAGWLLPSKIVAAVMTIVVTVAWSWYPSQLDSTGLWGGRSWCSPGRRAARS